MKASPLILIAVGLSFCFRANLWNIGAEGQFIAGGALGGWLGIADARRRLSGRLGGWWILPAMLVLGALGGLLYAHDPRAAARAARRVGDPDEPDARLCRQARPRLAGARPVADPQGFNFPQSVTFDPTRPCRS